MLAEGFRVRFSKAERGMAASKASRPSRHPGWTAADATSSMCMSSIYGAPATSASAWHRAASTPFKEPVAALTCMAAKRTTQQGCPQVLTFSQNLTSRSSSAFSSL